MNEDAIEPVLSCDKGNYTYKINLGGKVKVEKGCLGTERFGKILSIFRSL